jgi:hypothetical protein
MSSVLQPWVEQLTLMQQSVLITATRGPDGMPKKHIAKFVMRWIRRCYLLSAFDRCTLCTPDDPRGGNFTGPIPIPLEELETQYLNAVDEIPHHFHMHVVHAAEILGYKHPIPWIRDYWNKFYLRSVKDLHLRPESEEDMDKRLGDNRENWAKADHNKGTW